MSYKETKLYSILGNKCPHCHQGNFWEGNNPYDLKKWAKMNPKCPECNEDFKRETGFYFGAVYVSYGFTVGFGIVLYFLLCEAGTMEVVPFLILFSVLLLILLPLFYRSARLTWINFFVHYKKS